MTGMSVEETARKTQMALGWVEELALFQTA